MLDTPPRAIPGLPGWWQEIAARYDYQTSACRCPACGNPAGGVPWRGWFSCQVCPAVALVGDGRCWVPSVPPDVAGAMA